MNIYVESFEAYTAQHPLNEGLLTGSIKDKELSAKDGFFGGFNIAKLKSPIVTKNIKKDLDRYMEIGRKMVDDQAPNLKDENGKFEDGTELKGYKILSSIEDTGVDKKKTDTLQTTLNIKDEKIKEEMNKLIKHMNTLADKDSSGKLKDWVKIMVSEADLLIAKYATEQWKGISDEAKQEVNDSIKETEQKNEEESKAGEKEQKEQEEKKLQDNEKEINSATSKLDWKNVSDSKKRGVELKKVGITGINKELSAYLENSAVKTALDDKDLNDVYKNALVNAIALLTYYTQVDDKGEAKNGEISDNDLVLMSRTAISEGPLGGGYDKKISAPFQAVVAEALKGGNTKYSGTAEEIKKAIKSHTDVVNKVLEEIKKKSKELSEIASKNK